ncbi:MAG: AraC family transcriptional regulator [Lachnospiraceae bacterium]|nr:AraC family transcriptional regulator [Lachnospiraceae bacterium]
MSTNLLKISREELISLRNSKAQFIRRVSSDDDINAETIENMMDIMDASYFFDGDLYFLPPRAIDSFTKDHLLYIQNAGRMECSGNYYTLRSNLNSFLLLYVNDGQGQLKYDNKTYDLKKDDVFFIDCRQSHYYCTTQAPWIHTDIHLAGSLLPELYKRFAADGNAGFSLPVPEEFIKMIDQLFYIHQHEQNENAWNVSNQIERMLLYLIKAKSKKEITDPLIETLHLLRCYMENNFTKNFTIDELAAFSGISKYYLIREFKKSTGYTPIDYMIELRITHAKSLLTDTTLSVQEVAHFSGFKSMNNFLKHFEKRVGTTPLSYRKQFR